jgi:hypothetical protein
MSTADTPSQQELAARARWGDTVLRRSAAAVLERASLTDTTRAELEQLAARDGDDAR